LCTRENAEELYKLTQEANKKLLDNGIDLGDLSKQAGVALGEATALLIAKVIEDAKTIAFQTMNDP
jgi:hypothetical protein